MPSATEHTRDGTAWQPMPRPLTSIELQHCRDCLERTRRLADLGLEGTVAIRFDSGEVWHCTYGWLDEDTAEGWVSPTPAVVLDPWPHHPVRCERWCPGEPEWPGEWQALGAGWWRRTA